MTTNARMNRTAAVTGGARGLGRAMALGLAQAGYNVAAFDLPASDEQLKSVEAGAAALNGGSLKSFHVDVSNFDMCRSAVDAATNHFGSIDILVNNAGFGMEQVTKNVHNSGLRFFDLDEAFWKRLIDVNLNGAFRMAKLIAPGQIARGWGRIVNVTTSFATMVRPSFSPYGPSKAALEAATAIWAQELAGTGVTANILIPGGPADTRFIPIEDVSDRSKLISPDSMVPPLLWLMSRDADNVTNRRFIAKAWIAEKDLASAIKSSSAPVAWEAAAVWK